MITQEQRDADVMPDPEQEVQFEAWLQRFPNILKGDWKDWSQSEEDFLFFLKNRLRRAFEAGYAIGKYPP